MGRSFARQIIAPFILLPIAAALPQQSQTLPAILERCWGVEEIKSGHSSSFSSRNTDFDQKAGFFRAEVHRRRCSSSLEANGPVEHEAKREYLARVDSLTLRLSTDSVTVVLQERAGKPLLLTVNGRVSNADWWRPDFRERVLRLARAPLD